MKKGEKGCGDRMRNVPTGAWEMSVSAWKREQL